MTTTQPKSTERPHQVKLRVSAAELDYLRAESARTDRSISAVLRLALREYTTRREGTHEHA